MQRRAGVCIVFRDLLAARGVVQHDGHNLRYARGIHGLYAGVGHHLGVQAGLRVPQLLADWVEG